MIGACCMTGARVCHFHRRVPVKMPFHRIKASNTRDLIHHGEDSPAACLNWQRRRENESEFRGCLLFNRGFIQFSRSDPPQITDEYEQGVRKKRSASTNLRTVVDSTGEELGQPRRKGAWAGRSGQQLSIPQMKERAQERAQCILCVLHPLPNPTAVARAQNATSGSDESLITFCLVLCKM